jgi:hypothetical protein
MNASFTCTRRRLLGHLSLVLPLAWAAPLIRYTGATAREGPLHSSARTGLQGTQQIAVFLADVPEGLLDIATDIH